MRTYKFRLYPDKEQNKILLETFDLCRFVHNKMLEEHSKNPDKNHISRYITVLKKQYPELKQIYSQILQYECYRLFSNIKTLSQLKKKGYKVGRLRFKNKERFKTIVFYKEGFRILDVGTRYNILQLSKIGNIRLLQHREMNGKIIMVTIKRKVDSWEAHIVTDADTEFKRGDKIVGIDLGIKSFLTDNTGNKIDNPLFLNQSLNKLKKLHQNLARKKKGSKNRYKAKIHLSKHYEYITQQRDDFLFKTTTKLINNCKFIAIEKLNIANMKKISYNSRNINDSSWGKFLQILDYKAESAGCQIVKVNPRNTTKECSNCGNIQNMPLNIREYNCKKCGISLDRDINAAKNILHIALEQGNAKIKNNLSMTQETLTQNRVGSSQC